MQSTIIEGNTNEIIEWEYHSTLHYDDPFNALELDVHIISSSGKEWIVPTFWKGEQTWAVRFISKEADTYTMVTQCSDTKNLSLHQKKGKLVIHASSNIETPLSLHVSEDKSYLETQDEKPFFWLADTWWMGLSKRLSYPEDFHKLTQDRKEKGFTVIQLVIGLFPDMDDFNIRASNESGLVWEEDYARINPKYFDKAEERIKHLSDEGLLPCILGAWGYYIHSLGLKKMKQHWRYIIARWGVYPAVWCIAG